MSDDWAHDLLRKVVQHEDVPGRLKASIRHSLQPTEVEYRGVRMFVHPSDNNTEFQIWKMGRTHEEKALKHILRRLEGRAIRAFDVGANAGSFSTRLALAGGEGAWIDAFEPNPAMRARLEKNCALNGFEQVQIHDCAISDEPGEIDLHLPDVANLGQARLHEAYEGGQSVRVPVRCLAEFAPEDGSRVDFLKADVEGFEDRVIVPYLENVDPGQHPELIFFEHKHDGNWSLDLPGTLAKHGYELAGEYGRNALYIKAG